MVLIPYIPNFNNLTLADLPNFDDVRGVYNYKDNLIVTGIDKIVEYNPAKKEIVRVQDTSKIDSVYNTAKIDNYLYVVNPQGLLKNGKSWLDIWSRILKIDLDTGKIVKTYFGDPVKDKKYTNLYIASKDKYLWASSRDGVMKINTSTDLITNYSVEQLQIPNYSCSSYILLNLQGTITISLNCLNEQGILTYNEAQDSWTHKTMSSEEQAKLINKRLKDFNLDLPTYFAISNQINGKYYLAATDGIYTLKKDSMPIIFLPTKVNPNYLDGNSKFYVDTKESYLFLIGLPGGIGSDHPTIGTELGADLVNLRTGEDIDLIETSGLYDKPVTAEIIKLVNGIIKESKIVESGSKLLIEDQQGNLLLQINLETNKIEF